MGDEILDSVEKIRAKIIEIPDGSRGILFIERSSRVENLLSRFHWRTAPKNTDVKIIFCDDIDGIKLVNLEGD